MSTRMNYGDNWAKTHVTAQISCVVVSVMFKLIWIPVTCSGSNNSLARWQCESVRGLQKQKT